MRYRLVIPPVDAWQFDPLGEPIPHVHYQDGYPAVDTAGGRARLRAGDYVVQLYTGDVRVYTERDFGRLYEPAEIVGTILTSDAEDDGTGLPAVEETEADRLAQATPSPELRLATTVGKPAKAAG